MLTAPQLSTYRAAATRLLDNACGGTYGMPETAPIARAVTEQRDGGAGKDDFSSCGELPMWLLERLGVRFDWLNRAALRPYRWGMNISLLTYQPIGANPLARRPKPGERYECGDTLIIWKALDPKNPKAYTRDAHARVVLSHPTGSMATVAEYGQPGGHVAAVNMTWGGPGRFIQSVLKLEDVLNAAHDAGKLEQLETWEEWLARAVRDTEPAPPLAHPTLKQGAFGSVVVELQKLLMAFGYMLTVDGSFGPKTMNAVMAFQRKAGLTADGVVGPKTWAALQPLPGAA